MKKAHFFIVLVLCMFLSLGLAAGCKQEGGDEQPNQKRKNEKEAKKEKKDNVGMKDVIDYGTGKTPLEIKKKSEKKIKEIQEKHNKQLEEAGLDTSTD
ncbi:MAG: hypothetical protein ACLFWL_03205 [Candidatus Brocadiia bacterium]|nr:hypothetical protein [Planctomycetota bacterium]